MEIQVASGEWMNEFVRRPSRRRDKGVYVPAADIKRSIRRSWTISNPTPRWSTLRSNSEFRRYNSLPRTAQNISAYPNLVSYRGNAQMSSPLIKKQRSRFEDMYEEQTPLVLLNKMDAGEENSERLSTRVNPFTKLAQEPLGRCHSPNHNTKDSTGESRNANREDKEHTNKDLLTPDPIKKNNKNIAEKRVSFDNNVDGKVTDNNLLRKHSSCDNTKKDRRQIILGRYLQDDNSDNSDIGISTEIRGENNSVELCDIEPLSGTVFRKVTVRKRRQDNMRKVSVVDGGWRRTSQTDSDLPATSGISSSDILLPSCDDYRLVFVGSSDSSSKEDEADDSSSNASSFPPLTDECDWDYFEPGPGAVRVVTLGAGSPSPFSSQATGWKGAANATFMVDSPLSSPLVYRRRLRESDTGTDEDITWLDSCSPASSDSIFQSPEESTVAAALRCLHLEESAHHHHQKTPCHACGAPTQYIPIPVPVPIPFPVPGWSPTRLKSLSRNLWPYSLVWPSLYPNANLTVMPKSDEDGEEAASASPSSHAVELQQEQELSGYLQCENRYLSSSDSSRDGSDSSDTSREGKPHVRRMYNVSGVDGLQSDEALPSSDITSDCDGLSQSSVREDDMSSSGSADTDSNDTGTVADQKPTRFSRIFVVNKNISSSSNECSSSSDTDTSDNDTDTERDCTVILTNMRQLDEDFVGRISDSCDNDSGDIVLRKTKYVTTDKSISDESETGNDLKNKDGISNIRKLDLSNKIDTIENSIIDYFNERLENRNKAERNLDDLRNNMHDSNTNINEAISIERKEENQRENMDKLPSNTSDEVMNITIDREKGSSSHKKGNNEHTVKIQNANENIMGISIKRLLNIKMPNESDGRISKKKRKFANLNGKPSANDILGEKKESNLNNNYGGNTMGDCADFKIESQGKNELKILDENMLPGGVETFNESKNESNNEMRHITVEENFLKKNFASKNDCILANKLQSSEIKIEGNLYNNVDGPDENQAISEEITELLEANCKEYHKIGKNSYNSPVMLNIVDKSQISEDKNISEKKLEQMENILGFYNEEVNKSLVDKNLDECGSTISTIKITESKPILNYIVKQKQADYHVEFGSSDSIQEPCMLFETNIPKDCLQTTIKNDGESIHLINDNLIKKEVKVIKSGNRNSFQDSITLSKYASKGNDNQLRFQTDSPKYLFQDDANIGVKPHLDVIRRVDRNIDFIAKEVEYISSSPGLSDVSAESLNSSDVEENKTEEEVNGDDRCTEWNAIVMDEVGADTPGKHEVPTGATRPVDDECSGRGNGGAASAKYTSLVMITQESPACYQQVSVVTSDTTTLVEDNDVVVQHTNWQEEAAKRTAEAKSSDNQIRQGEGVTVITGDETLSAFEEGLADDDSWVENLSHDGEDDDEDNFATTSPTDDTSSGEEVTLTCSAAVDQEDELRGYHRTAIDFTLHTIVEESCEESEVEQNGQKLKERPASATDLEKYFFFGLGDGNAPSMMKEDAFSETSSIYSEGIESLGGPEENQQNDNSNPAELASSRLEKYFLSGFMGFTAERKDSDGSVGSDSEGKPSPEQRRKRLVRARGTGRSHSSSLDNLDNAGNDTATETQINSENSSSSDTDTCDEVNSFEKPDGQFDTVKRKKGKKHKNSSSSAEDAKNLETTQEVDESDEDEDGNRTPQPEITCSLSNLTITKNQQSRDSGFIGSCDDLDQRDNHTPDLSLNRRELNLALENISEEEKTDEKISTSTPPTTSLTRKDSFNNWSSDEETNLMMSKMRQFFKTMVANSQYNSSSKPDTPNLNVRMSPKPVSSPRTKHRYKPPQLVFFENELTRLMKTVPGLRDDQVREIVEYLSSEDTWSDSYDSSDYTSSDLEGTSTKSVLQQQISDSCKQIISKFDNSVDDEGDEGDGGILDESHGLNKETAFVYQKLVASFEKMATGDSQCTNNPKLNPHSSPPLIAKVMHHIGSRLVALMHEVSSGESHTSNSPKTKHYHRRLQHKISSASSTTTEDDGPEINSDHLLGFEASVTTYNLLPRSRSHDLLVGETKTSNQGGVPDSIEEREVSDCERFSWRGSFESALLATDSRNKLSLLGGEGSSSASALAIAAKRRSAGDLLFSHKSLSREQLDRVRSCGSIGGANSEDKLWVATTVVRPNRRRSSVPDTASCGSGGSADGEEEDEEMENPSNSRSTLPRSLQGSAQTTNSLPRLPTNAGGNIMQKSQSMYHFLPQNVKSARYRPPGLSRLLTAVPKRAASAPGLQPTHQRRGRRSYQQNVSIDDVCISEAHSSPTLASRNGKSTTPSPVAPGSRTIGNSSTCSSQEWQCNDDDIDRLVGLHGRSSLSSLGLRSESMASVYSGAGGEGRYGAVTVRGQVEFGLQYNYKTGALEVQVGRCRDLAAVDAKRGRSDPYVKAYLLPDRSKGGKRKTKVKKHTLNPVFDECLKFHISLNGLESRTLWLTVWHSDMFGRNDFLGEVLMALENKVFDDPTPKWYNLQERTEPFEDVQSYKGDIIVCLKFVPPDMTIHKKGKRSRGALHVLVKEAKFLTAVKANGTSDPFCKSYLLPDKGRSSKQKTPVARRSVNPVWNYTFLYDDVTLQELAERCLELTVWDHDRLASNEFLGGVRFSLGTGKHYGKPVEWMDALGKELSLWKSMLERPNFWVEGCLSLRPTLDTRPT